MRVAFRFGGLRAQFRTHPAGAQVHWCAALAVGPRGHVTTGVAPDAPQARAAALAAIEVAAVALGAPAGHLGAWS